MTSSAARAMVRTSVGAGGVPAAEAAGRHLRVLPPPAAYATVRGGSRGDGRGAEVRPRSVPAPRSRLTARGRRLVAVLTLAVGVGVVAVGDAVLSPESDGLELMGASSVVVERGDTLWAIARSVAGDEDVRDVVERIIELNALEGGVIEPGQVLVLP